MSDLTTSLLASSSINREETFVEDHFRTYLYTGTGAAQEFDDVGIDFTSAASLGSSVLLSGASQNLVVQNSAELTLAGEFTIDFWFRRIGPGATYDTVFELGLYTDGILLRDDLYVNGTLRISGLQTHMPLNTWVHIAVTRDSSNNFNLYIDGTRRYTSVISGTINSAAGGLGINTSLHASGQHADGYYTNLRIIDGTALYTGASLTVPTAYTTAVTNTALLTLTTSGASFLTDESDNSLTITNNGSAVEEESFSPFPDPSVVAKKGLVWFKGRNRSSGAEDHHLQDTVQNSSVYLRTSATSGAAATSTSITEFAANGFSIGTNSIINTSGKWSVAWCFGSKTGFFDIVEYTGTGANTTISHDLNATPGAIITKRTDTTGDWMFWHKDLPTGNYLQLHTTAAKAIGLDAFYLEPTKDQFFLGDNADVNTDGGTYISYIFGSDESNNVKGDGIIHCGSYTGTGNNVYQVVDDCGWEPFWLLIKNTSTTSDWIIIDQMRGWGIGDPDRSQEDRSQWLLYPNSNTLEINTTLDTIHVDPRGIRVRGELNRSGDDYVYIAIRRGPMRPPTADSVEHYYQTYTYTGDAVNGRKFSNAGARQRNDFAFYTDLDQTSTSWSSYNHPVQSRITGGDRRAFTNSAASSPFGSSWYGFADYMAVNYGLELAGSYVNDSGVDYIVHSFTRAPGFFDITTWIGDGTRDRQIPHNLQTIPALYLVKAVNPSASSLEYWLAYQDSVTYTDTELQEQYAYALGYSADQNFFTGGDFWGTRRPTASHIRVGDDNDFQQASYNEDGVIYSAFLWGDNIPGVIRNASVRYQNVDGPISFPAEITQGGEFNVGQPRFLLWKSFSGNEAGANTPWLTFSDGLGLANTGTSTMINWGLANVDFNTSFINTTANGFQLNISANNVIVSNVQSYIYMSIG